jgi:Ca2+-binding EF-hand superfamily protein
MKSLLLLPLAALLVSCGGGVAPGPGAAAGDNLQTDQERKVIALLEKFDRFDDNGNGQLTRSEIVNGIKFEGISGVDNAEIDRLFGTYDSNRNGSISLPEANAALAVVRR